MVRADLPKVKICESCDKTLKICRRVKRKVLEQVCFENRKSKNEIAIHKKKENYECFT